MRKILIIFLLAIFVSLLYSDQIPFSIAKSIAQNWYSMMYETEDNEIEKYSIEEKNGIQTLFIFNFEEGGFVITSASNDAEPILAYNNTGNIGSDRSPSLQWIINCYNEQVYEIIDENLYCLEHRATWSELITDTYTEDRNEVVLYMDP